MLLPCTTTTKLFSGRVCHSLGMVRMKFDKYRIKTPGSELQKPTKTCFKHRLFKSVVFDQTNNRIQSNSSLHEMKLIYFHVRQIMTLTTTPVKWVGFDRSGPKGRGAECSPQHKGVVLYWSNTHAPLKHAFFPWTQQRAPGTAETVHIEHSRPAFLSNKYRCPARVVAAKRMLILTGYLT